MQSTPKDHKVSNDADLSRSVRERHGWTQAVLAAKLIVSRNYVSQIEAGLKTPSKRLRLAMEELLTKHAAKAGQDAYFVSEPSAEPSKGEPPIDQLKELSEISDALAFNRSSKAEMPIDHEHAALLQKLEHALLEIQRRSDTLNVVGARDACRAARDVFARYMEAGADTNRIGWLNLEVHRLIDSAPWPKRLL